MVIVATLFVLGAGVIEILKRIEKAINQNYKDSLARAMTTTDLAVKAATVVKVERPCICEHAKTDHTRSSIGEPTGPCMQPNCDCQRYRPKRGPWPGEVKV